MLSFVIEVMSSTEDEDIEETNSGVKKRGNWKEISRFGKKVEEAIEEKAEPESLERFSGWRPKVEESEKDVKRKTVDEATLSEKKLEEESDGVTEDLKNASDKVAEAGKKAASKEHPGDELKEASSEAAKPFYSGIAGFFRRIESWIYSLFALRFNPYYLDTEDFSVDVKHRKKGEFEMDVAVPDKEPREELKKNLGKDNQ